MDNNKKKSSVIIVAAICVVVFVIVFKMPRGESRTPPPQQQAASQTVVYSVRSTPAQRQTLVDYIAASGDVEATRSIEVYPDMGGKLVRTNVSLGSTVRRGQTIAEVDPSTPGVPYEISPVLAPLSGAITSQPLQPGTTVSTSTAIAVIGSIDDLQVTISVPERYASLLDTGMQAEITLEAYPGVKFAATVVRVSPVVDSTSRTKELRLTFDEDDPRINAGMYAKVRLFTTARDNVIVVPETAILTSFGTTHVFVVSGDGSRAIQRNVEVGMTVDGLTEIVSGVTDTDRVIIEGMHLLYDGASIRDISFNRASAPGDSSIEMAEALTDGSEGSAV